MKKRVAVIGAGHAGISAVDVLTAGGCEVVLFSNEAVLPYYRPRLIALAFGQTEPEHIAIRQQSWFDERKIGLRLSTSVSSVNVLTGSVTTGDGNSETFEGMILACGGVPTRLKYEGDAPTDRVRTLWSFEDAMAIRKLALPGETVLILGGGVLGIEAAVRAARSGLKVTLIEHENHLLCGQLGKEGEEALLYWLHKLGISVRRDMGLARLMKKGNGIEAHFVNASCFDASWVLAAIGAKPDVSLALSSGLSVESGIATEPTLEAAPFIYAAGDVAQPRGTLPRCSARQATLQGKLAAENLLAAFKGERQDIWESPIFPLFMKTDPVEFHIYGITNDPKSLETRLDDGSKPGVYQGCLSLNNRPVAIRMVGTRDKFDSWSMEIFKVIGGMQ